MGKQCFNMCFTVYIVMSAVTHISELGINCFLGYSLWLDTNSSVWFSLVAGLVIIPLVIVQLVSAIWLLQSQNENLTSLRFFSLAFLHVIQLGFYWRHFSIFGEKDKSKQKKDISELCMLRLIYSFTSSLPLLIIHTYLILDTNNPHWAHILYAACGTTLFSSSWAMASFQRLKVENCTDYILPSCPGIMFRFLWRLGEITARIIALALFASLYGHWLYLVLVLHWITMCLCVCTSVLVELTNSGFHRVVKGMLIAYVYICCFINVSKSNATFRYSLFYIIMFFENVTLCTVWALMTTEVKYGYRYLFVFVAASSFFVCVVSLLIYYKFFHVHSSHEHVLELKQNAGNGKECINCKLSMCAKHDKEFQRPFNTSWLNQYDSDSQFYRSLLQESLAEYSSQGGRNSVMGTDWISQNFGAKSFENMSEDEKRSIISFLSSGTYVHHRRNINNIPELRRVDTWSNYSSNSRSICNDRFSCSCSDHDSSSQSTWTTRDEYVPKLSVMLTDNWDAVQETTNGHVYLKRLDSFHSLLRKDVHNWYSDNASSDKTLAWSQLPVTDLEKSTHKINVNPKDRKPSGDKFTDTSDKTGELKCKSSPEKVTGRRCKLKRNVNYVNEDNNVYMEMSVPPKAKKLSAVYENVAFTDDILLEPQKVFKISKKEEDVRAPWYACSESGDSALPTETFSSTSNCGLTDVENDSNSGQEFMI